VRTTVAGVILAGVPIGVLLALRPAGLTLPWSVYLPVHTALEVLAAAAYVATFAVLWFAAGAGAFREARARFIGPLFLGAAILETAHLLVQGDARLHRARVLGTRDPLPGSAPGP
jgi:hypothetical protein